MDKTQKWLITHFEEIVKQYGGKYVAIADEAVVAIGRTPKEVVNQVATSKKISLLRVPTEEELVCLL